MQKTVNLDFFTKVENQFNLDKTGKIAQNAIMKNGIQASCLNQETINKHKFVFSNTTKKGEITNQKQSGRCWMFSALNVARVNVIEKLKIKTFEFSQNYTLFFDKLEKANYFLESIIETKDEALDSRLLFYLLSAPMQDGGQWDMFKGLLKKYGAVPKDAMPETYHSSNTRYLDKILTTHLRCAANKIRKLNDEKDIYEYKEKVLSKIYTILIKSLGNPPKTFTFEYLDENDKYKKIENISPKKFFEKYVAWNLDDMVSLIHAPTEDKKYGSCYSVKYLQSVYEADKIKYLNVPLEILKKAAINSIKDGQPVWFGCDVGQSSDNLSGVMDVDLYSFDDTLANLDEFSKADRLNYLDSLLTHAMIFTGVNLDKKGNILSWQVENSWGDKVGQKGIFSMSDKWFDEYNYQIMVDKKYIPNEYLKYLDSDLIYLEPWDPFGALARIY